VQPERDEPTARLIREALDQARELVRVEAALAREEMRIDLVRAKAAAAALGGALATGVASLVMFIVTIGFAFSNVQAAALAMALGLFCASGALAFASHRKLAGKPLAEAKERLESNFKQLKERAG
jgi:Putative Actinobacterial Holin-X, holin superfamily III